MKLIPGPHGYLSQCPQLDSSCPTCGQFSILQNTVEQLMHNLNELTRRVSSVRHLERRITSDTRCRHVFIIKYILSIRFALPVAVLFSDEKMVGTRLCVQRCQSPLHRYSRFSAVTSNRGNSFCPIFTIVSEKMDRSRRSISIPAISLVNGQYAL